MELPISGGSSGQGEAMAASITLSQGLKRISPGIFLGKYELLQELSRGGMGVVYRARDSALQREVALKMILGGHFASELEVERFRVEAEAAAHLDHPNIVPVYDVGEHDGQPYFTMRLVEGTNLARLNAECGARSAEWLRRSARLMAKVAGAVHHAHERGILHRDLKPSNILIDEREEPHITDFGLAKVAKQDKDLTLTGATVGTPKYMAPEQAAGKTKQLTTAADVFSLGAILYELLTGQPPFDGDTPVLTVKRLLETEPRRPRSSNRLVDRDLETICLKCLEKDPKRRYESALKLAEDLAGWLNLKPIQARPISAPVRLVKWTRRQPALATLIGFILLALIGFVALTRHNLREVKIKLAETLLSGGEALAAKNNLARGKDQVNQAYGLLHKTGLSTLPADLSLLDIYRSGPPPLVTLNAHTGRVTCVSVLPDQRTLVSGGEDGMIRLWSFPVGRQAAAWSGHAGGVDCLALSPDGKFCVSAGKDNRIKVWDTRTSSLVRTITTNESGITSLSFSTNSDVFAAASKDQSLRIWTLSSGSLVQVLKTGNDQLSQIAFSPGGGRILAANINGGISIWNLGDPTHPREFNSLETCLTVTYSRDGKQMLRGDTRGSVILKPSGSDDGGRSNMQMDSAVTAVAFTPNGKRILAGARDGTVNVWDSHSANPEPLLRLAEQEDSVTALTALDNRLVVSADRDGKLRVWDISPDEWVPRLQAQDSTVSRALFSADGLLILSVDWDGQIKLWDTATGTLLLDVGEQSGVVSDVAFSPNGQQAVTGGEDGRLRIWGVFARKGLSTFPTVGAPIRSVAFSVDGKMVFAGEGPMLTAEEAASVGSDQRNYRLHVSSVEGRELHTIVGHRGGVLAIACSPDGHTVLTTGGDGKIRFWDSSTWQEKRSIAADRLAVNGLALTRDGQQFVSTGSSPTLALWETATGRRLRSFGGFRDEMLCANVSGNGSMLVAGTGHGDLKLWNLLTGTELHSFRRAHGWSISSVEFSPRAEMIVSASDDSDIRIWDVGRIEVDRSLGVAAAQARLKAQENPNEGAALLILGQWYQHRGVWRWAIEMFERARAHGANVPHLPLARCYWHDGQLKRAQEEFVHAEKADEAPSYYLQLCRQAVTAQVQANLHLAAYHNATNANPPGVSSKAVILQPGPNSGKDIWTSSVYSWARDGDNPGGGLDDYELRVGGWGDTSYSLLQFDLTGYPTNASSAWLGLYCFTADGSSPKLYLDRITEKWDWKTMGTGRDHLRLWWDDKPATSQWSSGLLPAPVPGGWYFIDITGLYNDWQAGRFANYGLQLRPPPHRNQKIAKFYSSDYTEDPRLRPKLVVTPQEGSLEKKTRPLGEAAP